MTVLAVEQKPEKGAAAEFWDGDLAIDIPELQGESQAPLTRRIGLRCLRLTNCHQMYDTLGADDTKQTPWGPGASRCLGSFMNHDSEHMAGYATD